MGELVEQDPVLEPEQWLESHDPAANGLSKWVFIEVDPHDEQLPAQDWPGKLRTLEPALERAWRRLGGRFRLGLVDGIRGTSPEVERRSHGSCRDHGFQRSSELQPVKGKETGGVELLIPGRKQHDVEIDLLEIVCGRDLDSLKETKL